MLSYLKMSLLTPFAILSCGVHKMLPKSAVLSQTERIDIESLPNNVIEYTSPLLTEIPIIPFQLFGISYDLDIVMVTQYPDVDMHEFVKLSLRGTVENGDEKYIWIAKESETGTLDQYIYSNHVELSHLFPEIPLDIVKSPFSVVDRSDDNHLDLQFSYTNRHGVQVSASYLGNARLKSLKNRNGSTMGHSQNQVMAVLDLPKRRFGKASRITYDAKEYKHKKILGIKPFRMAIQQSQGGLSAVAMNMWTTGETIKSNYDKKGVPVEVEWKKKETLDGMILFQENKLRKIEYEYEHKHEGLTFSRARVISWNEDQPIVKISVFPSLPDLRRRFKGISTSKFIIDVNDQQNHAVGEISCHWAENNLIIEIRPIAPWWVEERPMRGTIRIKEDKIVSQFKMAEGHNP